jgi:PTH1 family peptidyl-tRNA hydrolase
VKLVVGLGNPGRKYQSTRHNLGFKVIDEVAARRETAVRKETCDSFTGEWNETGERVVLAKPQTYMNRSGAAVLDLLHRFHVAPEDLLVVYDDVDLPFGRIRIRTQGSAGGHRGVASIIQSLSGAPFARVRIGVGRPPEGVETADHVLQPFTAAEAPQVPEIVCRAADAVMALLKDGAEVAMREFNRPS